MPSAWVFMMGVTRGGGLRRGVVSEAASSIEGCSYEGDRSHSSYLEDDGSMRVESRVMHSHNIVIA